MHGQRVRHTIILALSLILLTITGCKNKPEPEKPEENAKQEKKEEQPVPVEIETIVRGAISDSLLASANLEAEESVKVIARTSNRVKSLAVEEGDRVEKGSRLLRLEDEQQSIQVEKTKVQLEKAQREYERTQKLYADELISTKEFNDATYDYNQNKLSHEDALRELGYTEVQAPINGTITSRLVNLGDNVTTGMHLFDMVDFNTIVARIYISEKYLLSLREGLTAHITAQALPGLSYDGFVKRISPVVDPSTGTVKVTIGVHEAGQLRPGMYVNVALVLQTFAHEILVPKRALIFDNDQVYIYLVTPDKRAEKRFLQPRLSSGDWMMPEGGINEGDLVVVAGQTGLKDGDLVAYGEDLEKLLGKPEDVDKDDSSKQKGGPRSDHRSE